MDEKRLIYDLSARLTEVRAGIGKDLPFFGRLLLRLPTRFVPCGTACTDMRCVAFDPDFVGRLGDRELRFVYLHELMHCVLHHCTRAKGKDPLIYNIACDIVVNSLLLDMMRLSEFPVDGTPVMHLVPSGGEGRAHTAEEVYEMLRKQTPQDLIRRYGSSGPDDHRVWGSLGAQGPLEDQWDKMVREAAKSVGVGSGIPSGLRRHLPDLIHGSTTNWRQLLHDYLQYDRSDYTYDAPDRRYGDDIFMPSFQDDQWGGKVERVWVLIDTSGSVSGKGLRAVFSEIQAAAQQIGSMSGQLSFFDCEVSDPIGFESVEELEAVVPVGGGGTSFEAIFRYLKRHMADDPPKLILILTDGIAPFPPSHSALGVDVVWVIIDSDVEPEWGSCVHVDL